MILYTLGCYCFFFPCIFFDIYTDKRIREDLGEKHRVNNGDLRGVKLWPKGFICTFGKRIRIREKRLRVNR